MSTEIRKLISVFDAQTAGFEAGLKRIDAGEKQVEAQAIRTGKALDNSFKTPGKSLADFSQGLNSVLGGHLGPLTQGISTLSTSFTVLEGSTAGVGGAMAAVTGPVGIAVAAFAAEITVVVALTKGLFDLAHSTAEVQGHLFDLSQQTGVSVETLSALGELAKTTGGNLNTVSQSLVVFEGNMGDVDDANSKAAKTFKSLGVTVTDTEQTLRDTLKTIAAMPEGFEQTNKAAELFGRRGGKQMLAILKESKGDINAVIRELQGMGLANTDAAKRADEFNDQLVKLETQLMGLKVAIGNEVVPTITAGLKQVERIIKDNKEGIEALGFAAKGLTFLIGAPLVGAIQALGWIWKAHQPIINAIREAYEATAAAVQLVTGRIPTVDPNAIPQQPLEGTKSGILLLEKWQRIWKESGGMLKTPPDMSKLEGLFKKDKKASGADPALALFKQLRGELQGLNEVTKLEELSVRLLDKELKNISPTMKDQLTTLAKMIDLKRESMDVEQDIQKKTKERDQQLKAEQEALEGFFAQQNEELRELKHGAKTAADEVNDFRVAFNKLGGVLSVVSLAQARFNATMIDSTKRMRVMLEMMRETADLVPGPGGVMPEFDPNKVFTEAQQAELGLPPPNTDFTDIRRQMRELGVELTDIFSQSVGDGFNRGINSGLETLSLGLLRIVEDVFLKRMAEGLSQMLAGIGTGSGGGFLSGLLRSVIGGAAGGIGGGSGSSGGLGSAFAGAFASGGTIPMGQWGIVHENEKVFAGPRGAQVIPSMNPGGQKTEIHNHYTINLPPDARGSYSSPKSKRQLSETLLAALQQANT